MLIRAPHGKSAYKQAMLTIYPDLEEMSVVLH